MTGITGENKTSGRCRFLEKSKDRVQCSKYKVQNTGSRVKETVKTDSVKNLSESFSADVADVAEKANLGFKNQNLSLNLSA